MRVAVVHFSAGASGAVVESARSLASGIERQGHDVVLVNGDTDTEHRLTPYAFVAVGSGATSFFGGKISGAIGPFLSNSGMVAGKKTFVFSTNSLLGSQRALLRLMAAVEQEGMFVRDSRVVRSPAEAKAIGERLDLAI